MSESPLSPLEQTVVIVGVGLIGGSLGAALIQRKQAGQVIGVGRDAARLELARKAGLISAVSTDLAAAAARADAIVFCTPVDRIVEGVLEAARHAGPRTLLTDAGSVKQPICTALKDVPNFIGSHPIAGSHLKGFEAADAQLFDGRRCVLTPARTSDPDLLQRLQRLWQGVGMQTLAMPSADHDRALAMTSHLPHVVAAALARTLDDENRNLTGTGFRDTTRIAAGDSDLWTGILLQNAQHVIQGIDAIQQELSESRSALASGNADRIRQWLAAARQRIVNGEHDDRRQ